jgi:hypothetical protein
MSEDNRRDEQGNVNSGLQLSKDEIEGLKFLTEEAKQKKLVLEAEKKRKETLNNLKNQVGDDVYKQLEENGLKELAEQKPELLDTPAGLSQAIDNIKLRMELKKNQPPQEQQHQEEQEPGKAAGQGAGSGERKIPEPKTPEFMEMFSKGEISEKDIEEMDIPPETKLFLFQNRPAQGNAAQNNFFK